MDVSCPYQRYLATYDLISALFSVLIFFDPSCYLLNNYCVWIVSNVTNILIVCLTDSFFVYSSDVKDFPVYILKTHQVFATVIELNCLSMCLPDVINSFHC